jgi:hypothetical protein
MDYRIIHGDSTRYCIHHTSSKLAEVSLGGVY